MRKHVINFVIGLFICFCPQAKLMADLIDEDPVEKPKKSTNKLEQSPDKMSEQIEKPGSKVVPQGENSPKQDTSRSPQKSTESVLAPKKNPTGKRQKSNKDEPVTWSSQGIKYQRSEGVIFLKEDVVIKQGSMEMYADSAKIMIDESAQSEQSKVEKIEAEGHVKIFDVDKETGEKVKAVGDSMVFDNNKRTVVLSGNAKLWRGNDLVRGNKITYELDSGWIKADKVDGIVNPEEKAKK